MMPNARLKPPKSCVYHLHLFYILVIMLICLVFVKNYLYKLVLGIIYPGSSMSLSLSRQYIMKSNAIHTCAWLPRKLYGEQPSTIRR